jgi:hypothetical protein
MVALTAPPLGAAMQTGNNLGLRAIATIRLLTDAEMRIYASGVFKSVPALTISSAAFARGSWWRWTSGRAGACSWRWRS